MRLTLIVENTSSLEGGSSATKVFDQNGGSIGSGEHASWRLIDRHRSVAPEHVSISFLDGTFCATATSNKGLTVNGSNRPLPQGKLFRINDGDEWRVGQFDVHVHVSIDVGDDDSDAKQDWENRFASMDSIIPGSLHIDQRKARHSQSGPSDLLADLTDDERRTPAYERLINGRSDDENDPVELFDERDRATGASTTDPVILLGGEANKDNFSMDDQKLSEALGLTGVEVNKAAPIVEPNVEQSAFVPPSVSREGDSSGSGNGNGNGAATWRMNSHGRDGGTGGPADLGAQSDDLDSYLADVEAGTSQVNSHTMMPPAPSFAGSASADSAYGTNTASLNGDIDHVVLRPLASGLGVEPQDVAGPGADQFAKEVGQALRSAIEGLIAVRAESWTARVGRQRTHLQPIEDNPIKLGQNANEVLNDLFVSQNPVHLSAQASIQESLQEVMQHQAAAQIAVEEALAAVLEALAPEQLTKRFERYKGRNRRGQTASDEGWNWQMYEAYYRELKSSRQNGLSEMFWEVFFQNYDRETRRSYVNGGRS